MKNRFLAGVTAFCVGLSLLPIAAFAADSAEQSAPQYYSDVSDIIGPITPPPTEQGETDQTEGGQIPLPNPEVFQSNEDFKPYDPGYPEKEQYGNYTLRIPDLKERLTFSTGNKQQLVGTLYAPGVSRSQGWKDATKLWGNHDSGLCFAASSSNLISWYLERYQGLHPEDTYEYETNVERIFDTFRNGWDTAEGGDQKEALSWYFTGGFPSGNHHPNGSELTGKEPGGYLRNRLPHNTSDRWSQVSFDWKPQEVFSVYGSFGDNRFPYIEDVGGVSPGLAFSTLESFSKQVLRQLHYGPCTISIIADNTGGGSGHAITLWGVDYDVKTGLITQIHVTDSDDRSSVGLFTVKIERGPNNDGVRLVQYPYHPPVGTPTRFTRIRDSILLYAPDVVKSTQSYTGPQVEIQMLNPDSDGQGVEVQVSNISSHALEYGYSYDIDPDNVIRWQSDRHFSDLEPDQYYFFARVKETSDHAPGGTSAPSPYRVKTPSPVSQESVAALSLGTSVFHPYNGTHQYIWYGTEQGSDQNGSQEPILWRVLDTRTNDHAEGLFLISDKLYGTGKDGGLQFAPSGNDYQSSQARHWCQTFEYDRLAPWEQAAIRMTTKTDAPYSSGVTFAESQNILSQDRVFLPSAEEISNAQYGFGTAQNRQGRYRADTFAYWLRSPVLNESGIAGYVDGAGNVTSHAAANNYAARPAFNLDNAQVLYAAAVGNGQFADNLGLQKIQTVQSQDFRVVLKDASRQFRVTSSEIALQPGESVTLGYQGAKTAPSGNEYISVILMDPSGTTPVYYGKVAPVQKEVGEIRFELPSELAEGTYLLRVFNEQYNGEKKSGRASAFCDVSLTYRNQPAPEAVAEVNLAVPAPVTGQTPQNAQSGEDGYTVENTTWTPADDVFLANTSYSVSIVIKAKEGHMITEDTVFSLNGEPVTALKDGDAYRITYEAFPKTEDDGSGDSSNGENGNGSTPDGGTEGEDGSNPTPDSGTEGENGSNPTPDSGTEGENGSNPTPDSGTEGENGSNPTPDSGNQGENGSNPTPDSGTEGENGSTPAPDSSNSSGSSESSNEGSAENKNEPVTKPNSTPTGTASRPNGKQPAEKAPTNQNSKPKEDLKDSKQEETPAEMSTQPSEPSTEPTQPDETTQAPTSEKPDTSLEASPSSNQGYLGWILLGCSIPVLGFILFFVQKALKSKKK